MRNHIASIIIFLCDVFAFVLAFVVSGACAHIISGILTDNSTTELFLMNYPHRAYKFSIISFCVIFAFFNKGHYTRRISWWEQFRFISAALLVGLFIDGFSFFAMKHQFSRVWIVLVWGGALLSIIICRALSKIICEKIGIWKAPTVVIGSGDSAIDAIFALSSASYTGYDIKALILQKGFDGFNRACLPASYNNINIIDGSNGYSSYIKNHAGIFYIIAPDALSDINIESLVEDISDNGDFYAIVPPVKGISLYGNSPQYFFGHDVMLMQPRRKITSPFARLIKRAVDIFGSIILLIILFPVFLIISLLIKKDGGSVFFLNKRLGRGGKEFYCLKFRTMVPDAEKALHDLLEQDPEAKALWETHRKMKKDPRITRIGHCLRKSSADELPQLLNVLKGEMSLVGPRPILPDETAFFNKSQLASYYSVRPGMTGLWQVSGRNNTTFKQRVHLDDWYVTNWSIWHDIVIVLKTFSVLVKRSGAY